MPAVSPPRYHNGGALITLLQPPPAAFSLTPAIDDFLLPMPDTIIIVSPLLPLYFLRYCRHIAYDAFSAAIFRRHAIDADLHIRRLRIIDFRHY